MNPFLWHINYLIIKSPDFSETKLLFEFLNCFEIWIFAEDTASSTVYWIKNVLQIKDDASLPPNKVIISPITSFTQTNVNFGALQLNRLLMRMHKNNFQFFCLKCRLFLALIKFEQICHNLPCKVHLHRWQPHNPWRQRINRKPKIVSENWKTFPTRNFRL